MAQYECVFVYQACNIYISIFSIKYNSGKGNTISDISVTVTQQMDTGDYFNESNKFSISSYVCLRLYETCSCRAHALCDLIT